MNECAYLEEQTEEREACLAFLRVIADENRYKIIQILSRGERCVCDIWQCLGLAQNLTSHHLGILKEAGIVRVRREGTKMIYTLEDGHIQHLLSCLQRTISNPGELYAKN